MTADEIRGVLKVLYIQGDAAVWDECWAYNMGEHPEERSVGYPPPYGCEAVEGYDVGGKMGQYTVAAPDPGDVTKIGTARR